VIALATRCHHCGTRLTLDYASRGGFIVDCRRCLDPEGDSPIERLQGRGETPETALQHWFDRREELCLEPELQPSELSTFVVPKAPEGWGLTVTEWEGLAPEDTYPLTLSDAERAGATIFYGPILQKASNQ